MVEKNGFRKFLKLKWNAWKMLNKVIISFSNWGGARPFQGWRNWRWRKNFYVCYWYAFEVGSQPCWQHWNRQKGFKKFKNCYFELILSNFIHFLKCKVNKVCISSYYILGHKMADMSSINSLTIYKYRSKCKTTTSACFSLVGLVL